MQVRVLGPIDVANSAGTSVSVPGSKLRGLIAILALDAGNIVSTSVLIDALWGEEHQQGQNSLQVLVSRLRRTLTESGEIERIVTQPSGYRLDVDRDGVDALRFESLLVDAAAASGDATAAAATLRAALDLWSGAALADVPDSTVFVSLRTRLEELQRCAVEDLVDAELALGHHDRLAPQLEALVSAEPLRERRWCQLMRALYGSGQQAGALRAFQRARDILLDELGLEPSAELRRLESAVLAQDASLLGTPGSGTANPPIGEGFRRRGNLRHPVGSCVGREQDVGRLIALAAANRLVTLSGPGGVGKTRLAAELGVALMPHTPGGVWWVELAAARGEADVLAAIRRTLRLEPTLAASTEEDVVELAAVIGGGAAVLVLDNCEHLLGAVGPVIAELLGQCGELRVVATSREGLGERGELLFTVGPLALPDAISLFQQRISGLGEGDDVDPHVIAQICERLDRLPLALELAAGRARHMGLSEILARLADRLDVPWDDSRTPRPHQRDLRAVADWSYELLDPQERIVFERLSVFAGGATLSGATAVCCAEGVAGPEVERLLGRLIDKSLIYTDRSGSETRFRMLQTLADYASELLTRRGDGERARQDHALWVRDLARSVAFGTSTTGATIAAIQDEDVAVRDAVGWALVAEPRVALEICSMLAYFWFCTMRVSTGWELLSQALDAAADGDRALRSSALGWAVVFSTMQHDLATADRLAEEATGFAHDADDPEQIGRICFARALAAGYRGDVGAGGWAAEARANFELARSSVGLGHVSLAEGAADLLHGDLVSAETGLREASELFRAEQDHLGLIVAVSRLGEAAWRRGDLELFAAAHAELLDLGRSARAAGVVSGATARLALALLLQGDLARAETLADDALSSSGESFMPVVNGYVLKTAGLVNLALGHVPEGRIHLQQAIDAFARGTGNLGTGQAALCWIDLSQSHATANEIDDARRAAEAAVGLAQASADPWVQQKAEDQLAGVARPPAEAVAPASSE
jgi:predicted ATPase/DNA-binding SARP family transcriptional activator